MGPVVTDDSVMVIAAPTPACRSRFVRSTAPSRVLMPLGVRRVVPHAFVRHAGVHGRPRCRVRPLRLAEFLGTRLWWLFARYVRWRNQGDRPTSEFVGMSKLPDLRSGAQVSDADLHLAASREGSSVNARLWMPCNLTL